MDLSRKSAFVDRKEEMGNLITWHDKSAKGSEGRLVLVVGEAGIGKTRLIQEFGEKVEAGGSHVIQGNCVFAESAEPYSPFLEAMGPYLKQEEEVETSSFSMGMMGLPTDPGTMDTGVAALGLRSTSDDTTFPRGESIQDKKSVLFESFVHVGVKLSAETPLVIFIDDFQWADSGSVELLSYLARHLAECSVLMCVAYRPEELENEKVHGHITMVLEELTAEPFTSVLHLGRLEKNDIAKMTASLLDRSDIPDKFIDVLYRESEGNPFFVEEVLKALISEGVIDLTSSTWNAISLSHISIPRRIKDVVSRRILRLDEPTLRVLRYAGIIGHRFSFDLLREVTDLNEEDLVGYVDTLIDAKLIHEDLNSEEEEFTFDHIQIITVVYEGMSRSRLRVMHKRVGEALEKRHKDSVSDVVYALAKHFFVGKVPEKAVPYSILAAKKASAAYAMDDALNYYFMALNVIDRFPDKGDFYLYKGDVLFNIGWVENLLGEWDNAFEHYSKAVEINQAVGNNRRIADSYREMGHLHMERNNWEKADDYYRHALEIYEEIQDYYGIADTYRGHAKVDWRLGRLSEAIEHINKSIENAIRVGDDSLIGSSYIDLGNVYANKGDTEAAKDQYRKAIEILTEAENYPEVARAYNNIGEVFKHHGEYPEALENYLKCLEYAERGSDVRTKGYALGNLGETYAKIGEIEKAEDYTGKALRLFEKLDEKYVIASLYMNYGILYSQKGDWENAESSFDIGIEMMKSLNIQYDLGLIYTEYAVRMLDKGDESKAKEMLDLALELFVQIGAKTKIEEVKEIMESIG